jgi:hypothetical protein
MPLGVGNGHAAFLPGQVISCRLKSLSSARRPSSARDFGPVCTCRWRVLRLHQAPVVGGVHNLLSVHGHGVL